MPWPVSASRLQGISSVPSHGSTTFIYPFITDGQWLGSDAAVSVQHRFLWDAHSSFSWVHTEEKTHSGTC